MLPWKVFIRSVGAVTVLTMGGLAAGADVVPFSHASRSVGTLAVLEESSVPADTSATPAVDEAAVPADGDDVAVTDIPGSVTPDIVDDGDAPVPTDVPAVEVTEKPEPAPTAPTAAPDAPDTPPPAPAEDDAPVVCAAAAEATCGPADAELAADSKFDSRVQRCQAWWTRLADRLEERGRPRWAARARQVADRCDEMVARWQERQERREQRREERRAEPRVQRENRPAKGDHNCDGHPDNGWRKKAGQPVACQDAARPETAPGQAKKAERHREGRR